jgi:Protein of unknown function (DUF1573)
MSEITLKNKIETAARQFSRSLALSLSRSLALSLSRSLASKQLLVAWIAAMLILTAAALQVWPLITSQPFKSQSASLGKLILIQGGILLALWLVSGVSSLVGRYPISIYLGFVILGSIGCVGQATDKNETAQSNQADNSVLFHDFGDVCTDQTLSHRFEIRNNSTVEWNLKSFTTSCSCTVLDGTSNQIMPNSAATFTAAMKIDAVTTGPKAVRTSLVFRGVENVSISLELRANVHRPVEAIPSSVEFAHSQAMATVETSLVNYCSDKWGKLRVVSHPKWLSVSVVAVEALPGEELGKQRANLRLSPIVAELPVESVTDYVLVEDDVTKNNVSVPIRFRVARQVTVGPSSLILNGLSKEESVKKSVLIVFDGVEIPDAFQPRVTPRLAVPTTYSVDRVSDRILRLNMQFQGPIPTDHVRQEQEIAISFPGLDLKEQIVKIVY